MTLMNINGLPLPPMPQAAPRAEEVTVQFDAMLSRLMLQNLDLAAGIGGGRKAEHGVFRALIVDFLTEEVARQQASYGTMMLNMNNMVKGGNAW